MRVAFNNLPDTMTQTTIIPFNANSRLLAKAQAYLSALDQLILDGDQAVQALIRALDVADSELKLKIVLMLGAMAATEVITPLYTIMTDRRHNEAIRHAAAVQLSLVAGSLPANQTEALAEGLIADLGHTDPEIRANAAYALGWEGNRRAIPELLDILCDEDMEVQQAAVSALSNIRDERLFATLADRLMRGTKEQQRCILYHLGFFSSKQAEVVRICTRYLSNPDADLRYDALVVIDAIMGEDKSVPLFLQSLRDSDARIREKALVYLTAVEEHLLKEATAHIRPLLQDPSPAIRQAAIRLMHHIHEGPAAVRLS
jgi:HEAT repeat protein